MPVRFDLSVTLEHIEQLIAFCPIAIAHIDASRRVRYSNPAFEHLFGYRKGEPLGRRLESLVGFEENDDVVTALGRLRTKPLHFSVQARRQDQTPIDLEFDVIPNIRTGRSAGYWGIFQDVSARHNAEATLSKVTQTMIEAQEHERFRIAKELHDDVAQGLTVLQLGLERLKICLPAARAGFNEQLETLQVEARRIAASVRVLSLDLDVPTLGLLAIDRALERLCDDIMARRGTKVHCTISHVPRSVPHDIALAVFRVVQDALNLAELRGTHPVRLALTGAPGTIHLDIRDLGSVRIDDSDAGLRLLTMRERVAMVNGTFSMASPSEKGTEIEISIPLAGG
jgi:PAS domain S-box-containing protein